MKMLKVQIFYYLFIKNKIYMQKKILVGALSSNVDVFSNRFWELSTKIGLDFTNSFSRYIHISKTKNGTELIKRIQGSDNLNTYNENIIPWIDDKTRLFFEGFATYLNNSKIINIKISLLKNKKKNFTNKDDIIQIVLYYFYLFDHFNSHSLKTINSFIFIFGNSLSIETFSLLVLTFNKYSFLKIKTTEILSTNNNLENTFQINSSLSNTFNLINTDVCLLIGVNTRYEGSFLNLKLRNRYYKSDFTLFSIGSVLDLTFPSFVINSNIKILNSLIYGNHLYSQIFKTAKNLLTIINLEYFRRIDNTNIFIILEIFKSYTYITIGNWNGFSILSSSLNDVGITTISNITTLKMMDLKYFNVIYLINTPLYSSSIKILLELKLLNFFFIKKKKIRTKILFNQCSIKQNNSWFTERIKKSFNFHKKYFFYIPVKNFFEISKTYKNAEGLFKKSINIIKSEINLKSDWKFLRQVFKKINKKITYLKNVKDNNLIYFNSMDIFKFRNFIALQLYTTKIFTYLTFSHLAENTKFNYKIKTFYYYNFLQKSFNTKIKFWIEDFFIGGRDLYSKHSISITKSSFLLRINRHSFYFLNDYTYYQKKTN